MDKIIFTSFVPEHAYKIIGRTDTNIQKFAEEFAKGTAYTAFMGDELFGCGGVVTHWEGCGEVWLLPSPLALKHPVLFYKTAKQTIDGFVNVLNFRRLQAPVEKDNKTNRKFIERLGFHAEGILECYGLQGQDHVMYALINRR